MSLDFGVYVQLLATLLQEREDHRFYLQYVSLYLVLNLSKVENLDRHPFSLILPQHHRLLQERPAQHYGAYRENE